MQENEKLLKELRRREFQNILNNKEFLIDVISKTLQLDKDYVRKHIKLKKQKNYNQYDLITKITETRIKIRTSENNKIVERVNEKGKFHIAWYDEKNKEYKMKIYLDKVFEHCYEGVQNHEEARIKEILEGEELTHDDLINLSILRIILMHSGNIKISICSKI